MNTEGTYPSSDLIPLNSLLLRKRELWTTEGIHYDCLKVKIRGWLKQLDSVMKTDAVKAVVQYSRPEIRCFVLILILIA